MISKEETSRLANSLLNAGFFYEAKNVWLKSKGERIINRSRPRISSENKEQYQMFESKVMAEIKKDSAGLEQIKELLEEVVKRNSEIVIYAERKKDKREV